MKLHPRWSVLLNPKVQLEIPQNSQIVQNILIVFWKHKHEIYNYFLSVILLKMTIHTNIFRAPN